MHLIVAMGRYINQAIDPTGSSSLRCHVTRATIVEHSLVLIRSLNRPAWWRTLVQRSAIKGQHRCKQHPVTVWIYQRHSGFCQRLCNLVGDGNSNRSSTSRDRFRDHGCYNSSNSVFDESFLLTRHTRKMTPVRYCDQDRHFSTAISLTVS